MISRLLLTPRDPNSYPNAGGLSPVLGELGLLGPRFTYAGHTHYMPGDGFLDLVTFLGCSPAIELAAPDPDVPPQAQIASFCHLREVVLEDMTFVSGRNTTPPRCPHCRETEPRWEGLIRNWEKHRQAWHCTACEGVAPPWRWNWRQSAGFGRWFLEVWGVHPAEAVPGEPLLSALEQFSGGPWKYFYTQTLT